VRRLTTHSALANSHSHLTAEFIGVPPEQLRDSALLGGLLIAAASAAGFSLSGVPIVREHVAGGVSAMVLLDHGHLAAHSVPERQTLLFDAVAPASHDFRKALEVLSRRLSARDLKTDTRGRG
jgi:S-adenosylmethionine/arginine decarboxylase-like enzyme